MSQFDNEIRSALLSKLDSVHASDDLIAATLKSMNLEEVSSPAPAKQSGTLSAIDTRFIRNHVKTIEKNARKQNAIRRTIIVIGSIAASAIVLSGSLLAIFALNKINAKDNSKLANYAYVTWNDSYNATIFRNYGNRHCESYYAYLNSIESITSNTPEELNDLDKIDTNSKLDSIKPK